MQHGYYRYPAISGETLMFISEGDLWIAEEFKSTNNPTAFRLTTNRGLIKSPVFSPDGKKISFSSSQEGGGEVYIMGIDGQGLRRLTYDDAEANVVAWVGGKIYYTSCQYQPFARVNSLWCINENGGIPEEIPLGPMQYISFRPGEKNAGRENLQAIIQRHGYREYGYWKRYRGGTAGTLWISQNSKGDFKEFLNLKADLARPLWLKDDTIVFSSDHEGVGNLYQADVSGENLRRLTHHQDFYVRGQCAHEQTVVYHAGGDLFYYDLKDDHSKKINLNYRGDRQGRVRKPFKASSYLQSYDLDPKGRQIAINTRGKVACMGTFLGPVTRLGDREDVRYRLPTWIDCENILMVADDAGKNHFEIYNLSEPESPKVLKINQDIGRIDSIYIGAKFKGKKGQGVILYNHRHEILYLDIEKSKVKVIDRSTHGFISGGQWSADGQWFAYGAYVDRHKAVIKIYDRNAKMLHQVTPTMLTDGEPAFDPDGKYLYFIGDRHFDPVHDHFQFDHGFAYGSKLYAIGLQKDVRSPFLKLPEGDDGDEDRKNEKNADKGEAGVKPIKIDFDDIQERLTEFPIESGRYSDLIAAKGKIYFLSHPIVGALEAAETPERAKASVEQYDLETLRGESIMDNASFLSIARDLETLVVGSGRKIQVFKAGEKPEDVTEGVQKSGRVNIERVKLMVTPAIEWCQMFKEAWQLQKDHYWVEDMSNIDWQEVYDRYQPLLSRVSTREEFSDLVWEMQGELGTSHAYVMGGDLKRVPHANNGILGAQFKSALKDKGVEIAKIFKGDSYEPTGSSPLCAMGVNLKVGDKILAIDGQSITQDCSLESLLIGKAGQVINLSIQRKGKRKPECVHVKTLHNGRHLYYRHWVEHNRRAVHEASQGQVGYIHIPDMSTYGYAEFHRSFMQEKDRPGLIVDVRFNGGGSVSQLLIDKLSRKRAGYDVTRYMGNVPYPEDSPLGPMVCLTNEHAGSDGDMFTHVFKYKALGPVIGKRTWGGVIGIWPRYGLVDGGMTSQPEFSFWFEDAGWSLENHGAEPDIEVEITPQNHLQLKDPQLEFALKKVKEEIAKAPSIGPDMNVRPDLRRKVAI